MHRQNETAKVGRSQRSAGAPLKFKPSQILLRFRRLVRNDQLVLGGLALVVGLTVGFGVILFRDAIDLVQLLYYGSGDEHLASVARALPWHWVLAAPIVGGLVVGVFYKLLMPGHRPLGIPEVIEAAAFKGGRMPMRPGLMAVVGSALSLGAGGFRRTRRTGGDARRRSIGLVGRAASFRSITFARTVGMRGRRRRGGKLQCAHRWRSVRP